MALTLIFHHCCRRRTALHRSLIEDGRNDLLLRAAAEGQTPRLRYLLHLGVDIDHVDDLGLTALHHAALSGFEDVAAILIGAGADVNALSDRIGTPFHLACLKIRSAVVDLLLNSRANVHLHGRLTATPLHCAVHAGGVEVVEALLHIGSSIYIQSIYCPDIVKHILEKGAEWEAYLTEALNPQTQSFYRVSYYSPLHVGYAEASNALVSVLLRQGSSQSYANLWTMPRLVDTVANRSDFRGHMASVTLAALNDDPIVLETCLSGRMNFNVCDSFGRTALMYAAGVGRNRNVKALLDAGAHANARNREGLTAVIIAAQAGHVQCVKVLLENGTHVDWVDSTSTGLS